MLKIPIKIANTYKETKGFFFLVNPKEKSKWESQ